MPGLPPPPAVRRARSRVAPWLLAVAVLLAGLGITAPVVVAERHRAHDADRARLTRLTEARGQTLVDAVDHVASNLASVAAFQAANGDDSAAFADFTQRLHFSDAPMSYVSYVVPVAADEVADVEARQQATGQPAFHVDPGPADGRYHVVLFSGPTAVSTTGADLGRLPELAEALDRAADTGLPVLTDPFVRLQDRSGGAPLSVAVYVPVYAAGAGTVTVEQRRAAFLGWAATALPLNDLLADTFAAGTHEAGLTVWDADDPGRAAGSYPAGAATGGLTARVPVDVLHQRWVLEGAALPAFVHSGDSWLVLALSMVAASCAASVLAFAVARHRRRLTDQVRAAVEREAATQQRFRTVFDTVPVGVAVVAFGRRLLHANPALAELLGTSPDELAVDVSVFVDGADDLTAAIERLCAGEADHAEVEARLRRRDGTVFWSRLRAALLPGDDAFVMVVTDISQEREAAAAAEELRSRRDRFEAMVQHSSDLIAVVGVDGRVAYASRAVSELFGVDPGTDGAVGADPLIGVLSGDRAGVAAALQYAMAVPGVHGPVQCRIVRADGSRRVVEVTATNLLDDPDVGGLVLACRDVTSQAEANDALRQRAFSDPLTGLATRDVLLDRLGTALAAARETGDTVAVLFVDLDRFKQVNDRFGHDAGDALLVAVADALAGAVRPGDMLARHGGDEFVVLLDTVRNEREARSIAERARLALRAPVVLPGGRVVEPGASIGIALSDGTSTPAGMLRDADSALYRAKQSGRDRIEVFDEALRLRAARRIETEAALRRALDGDGLALGFEPVADLVDGGIVGAEARIRLRLPSGEAVAVSELLPLAQEVGLSTAVVSDALESACRAAASWSAETGLGRWVGLDVSAGEVTHPTFTDRLSRILATTGVEAGAIGLELPIDVVTTEASLTGRAIAAVRALGVRVVLDGVGAELRSLAALGAFPVDGIKLDLGVLPDAVADPVAAAVAASVGEVAGAAGVPVIVVGADRPEQLDVVRRLGFRFVQGLAVAPLVDEVDLVALRR